jgi:hypothetical protein
MRLLLVSWRDAVTNHAAWEKLATIAKQSPEPVQSVGWELKRTKTKLTLVASISGDEGSQDVTIPIPWIVSERELK